MSREEAITQVLFLASHDHSTHDIVRLVELTEHLPELFRFHDAVLSFAPYPGVHMPIGVLHRHVGPATPRSGGVLISHLANISVAVDVDI